MLDLNRIDPKWIVMLDKTKIGMWFGEVLETKGKYIIFRENMPVDDTLYNSPHCSAIVDGDFVEKVIGMFTADGYEDQLNDWCFAESYHLYIDEIDRYRKHLDENVVPLTVPVWRNQYLNKKHGTEHEPREYISRPNKTLMDSISTNIFLGEYRLGVFVN